MSLTSFGETQPSLAWTFESSNVDYVTGLTPSTQVSPGPAQLQGSAALVTDAPTSNTAVYFPGPSVGGYMDLGSSGPTTFDTTTSNCFVECWVYFNAVNINNYIYTRASTGATGTNVIFRLAAINNQVRFNYNNTSGNVNGPTTIQTGRWYHIAVSSVPTGTSYCFIDGVPGTGASLIVPTYVAYSTRLGVSSGDFANMYIRDLRVVQGGVVPVANFTPGAAPFSYASPGYVPNMGTTVFTLLGQFVTYNPSGKYNKSIVLVNDVTTPTRLNALNFSPPVINIDSGITIAFWVKFQQIGSGTQTLFNFGGPGTGGGSTIIFSLYNPGTVSMWYKDTSYYTISTSTLVINTWYHLCISVGSGNLSAYLNGTSLDSKTYTPSNQTITYFSMGAYNGAGTPSSAEYDDLRIYNTALTSSQVQSIYRAQGMPSRAVQTLAYPYDNIGITSSAAGLWSTRRLRSAYAGPVVNVRRNSDNAQLDFIADQFGNLSNVQSAVTIDTWLASTTGNVTMWYDQFRSNNFTQATATSQPQIVKNSGKWVVFFNRDNLSGTPTFYNRMTIPNQISGIKTILYGINTGTGSVSETLLGQSGLDNAGFRMSGGTFFFGIYGGDINNFLYTGGRAGLGDGYYLTYWYNNNKYGSSVDRVNANNPRGQWGLVIGSTPGYTSFGFNSLSDPQSSLTSRAFYGYLSEVAMFTEQVSQVDAGSLYADQYISRTISSTLTGAPLFNQLSSSAASSAVGAFSLRAVNGVTAKAVNVAPGGTFPPSAMTSNGPQSMSGYPFGGSGNYTASASSNYPGELPFYAFDKQDQANPSSPWNIWTSGGGTYNTTTGQYTGAASTTIDGSAYTGEWLQISLPVGIVLTTYTIFTWNANLGRGPRNFKIAGSNTNNGTDWVTVDTRTGITNWTSAGFSFTTTSTTAYSYFRMCVNYNNADQYGFLSISEWKLFGSNASWNTDFYADERGNLLTAPVVGTSLQNWLGGATGYVTKWYDQSGRGNDASQNTAAAQPIIQRATKGAGYSCLFNGTTTQLVSTLSGSLDSTNYTICSASRRRAAGEMYYIGTNGPSSTRQQLSVGYYTDTTTILNEQSYALVGVTIPGYSSSAEPMGYDYSVFSQTNGMYIYNWRSGTAYASGNSGLKLPMTSSGNILLGYAPWSGNKYFSGEMFEILVLTSSLFDLSGSTPGTYTTPPSIIQSIYQNQLGYTGT